MHKKISRFIIQIIIIILAIIVVCIDYNDNVDKNKTIDSLKVIAINSKSKLDTIHTAIIGLDKTKFSNLSLDEAMTLLSGEYISLKKELENTQAIIDELGKKSNIIQSLELHVFVNIKTLESQVSDRETSAGLSSAVALFAKDKTRYRFVTDFQYTIHQITPTVKRIEFIYRPEDPLQISGKQINFLKNVDTFVCNYQGFLETVRINDNLGSTLDINVFLNGVDVITLRNLSCNAGVLSGGQAEINISDSFSKISERYIVKIKEKGIEK